LIKNVKSISDFVNDNDDNVDVDADTNNITSIITTYIVNVASRCGFTHVNYRGLRELYDTWGPKGLEILAFPSNQFGNQEPGSNEEIQLFCRDYGLSFPVMAKVG
jgi:glutathione peroxidase-family protein